MTPRKILVVSCALLLALGTDHARAADAPAEPAVPAVPKLAEPAVSKAAPKKAAHKNAAHKAKATAKTTAAKASKRAPKTAPVVIVTMPPADAKDYDYRARIQEAQELVAKQPVLPGDMQVDAGGKLTHYTWTLAVGAGVGPLQIVRMDETGKNDAGLTITWAADNFLNTHFRVAEGLIVFAQRRPVHAKDGYEEAVYTAYAPELDTKTMRAAGMEYLRFLQRNAYARIKDHDVRSRVAPDATVAEQIPTSMVLRLMIAEHVDPLHMKYVGIEQCVHEVLFTLAANTSHAYAYAKSSVGARGLPQFMEDSYQMVRANYPKALLEPDFERGIVDMRNAVLATVLLMDLELTELPQNYYKKFTASTQQLTAFLAAGYNRNPAHVVQTYHRTHSLTGGNAPFQSKMYVRIQSWVGDFLKKEYDIS